MSPPTYNTRQRRELKDALLRPPSPNNTLLRKRKTQQSEHKRRKGTSTQDDDSSLCEIVGTNPEVDPWRKLRETEWLAKLHAKFWGTSMEVEERVWRKAQLEKVDVDERTGADKGNDIKVTNDEGAGERIDAEDTEGEDYAGCYVLDIGIPGLGKMWIRKEDINVYECCDDFLTADSPNLPPQSVVVTGQPGIGKSYWIFYALRRRLAERKPTIWYRNSTRYLFVKEGVYEAPKDFHSTDLKTRVWTLVDTDHSPEGIPPELAVRRTQHLIIFTTSPQSERWELLKKTTRCGVLIMNPWTRKDILQAAVVHRLANNDHQSINKLCDDIGPTPRVYNFVRCPPSLVQHQSHYELALENLSLMELRQIIEKARDWDTNTISRELFMMKRNTENLKVNSISEQASVCVEPITRGVEIALRNRLSQESESAQFELYNYLMSVGDSGRTAGVVFESMGHTKLRERIVLKLFPMTTRESGGFDGEKVPPWYSSHEDRSVKPISIDVKPVKAIEYEWSSLEKITPDVYYVPESENQGAFDSFIIVGEILYIFQFSMASRHPIKPGTLSNFPWKLLSSNMERRFVFVIPPGLTITCLQPRDERRDERLKELLLLNGMRLFSADYVNT